MEPEVPFFLFLWASGIQGMKIIIIAKLLCRGQANLCFHFAGSGENLLDIAKSRDASMDNMDFSSLNSFLF